MTRASALLCWIFWTSVHAAGTRLSGVSPWPFPQRADGGTGTYCQIKQLTIVRVSESEPPYHVFGVEAVQNNATSGPRLPHFPTLRAAGLAH